MIYKCFIIRKSNLMNIVVYYESKLTFYEKEKVIL